MFAMQKFFNYITLVLAIITVGTCIYVIIAKKNVGICLVLLILTLILNSISRVYNNKNMNLTKKDREVLDNIKKK